MGFEKVFREARKIADHGQMSQQYKKLETAHLHKLKVARIKQKPIVIIRSIECIAAIVNNFDNNFNEIMSNEREKRWVITTSPEGQLKSVEAGTLSHDQGKMKCTEEVAIPSALKCKWGYTDTLSIAKDSIGII